jgi:hypothetical protein
MFSFVRRFEVKIFILEGEVHMEGARQRSRDLYFFWDCKYFDQNFYFNEFLFFSKNLFLFSRTFFLSLPFSTLTGLSCFRKVKWKMQFILCFMKSANKSLRSQSLNFPLKSCYCHQNLSIVCLQSQNFFSLLCNFFSLLCKFFSQLCKFFLPAL